MKIKFYVLHHDLSLYTCFVISRTPGIKPYILGEKTSKVLSPNCRIFVSNSYSLHFFLNEIECCPTYHLSVVRTIKSSTNPVVIKLIPNRSEFIDKTWGEIVRILVWEQLETDHMMSWLSTLGGAFSALGDYFESRAEIAGNISLQQMRLACKLGDPGIISRCLLYLSISLIQKHKFKLAKRIIKSQFEFAEQSDDIRLRKMCLGIWSKLQYTHKVVVLLNKRLKQ